MNDVKIKGMAEQSSGPNLVALIFSVILILLVGYYYNDPFVIRDSFHSLRIVVYLVIPFLLNRFYFRFPWSEMGIARPKLNRNVKIFLIVSAVFIPLIVYLVSLSPNYLSSYPTYRNLNTSVNFKLTHFFIFTATTLLGWEFLLRGFLLFGLRSILQNQCRIKLEAAQTIAISWVCTFEVLYHFVKPDLEALGMLIASPILSWLAFKTRSVFIPLCLHLYIELAFILVVIFS